MSTCDVCGNEYDHAFTVRLASGESFTFDSLECAAHQIAPRCAQCGCRVLGHGIHHDDTVFCCASCARGSGVPGAVDNVSGGS